jgi:hypothetical protein
MRRHGDAPHRQVMRGFKVRASISCRDDDESDVELDVIDMHMMR